MTTHRFPIGTRFTTHKKVRNRLYTTSHTVVDQMTVTNAAGEVVRTFYVAEHEFGGQMVRDNEVCDTTIARGLVA
jgi:hypothetical protein